MTAPPTLFPDLPPEPHDPQRMASRCIPARSGTGPAGETCGTCLNKIRVHYHDKHFLKCGLVKAHWTHGPGSDIRAKWEACRYWEDAKQQLEDVL